MNYPSSTLRIYVDQEASGMFLLIGDDETSTVLSHADFIGAEWLRSVPTDSFNSIEIVLERAHTVGADKSPAQRFTDNQWSRFKEMCRSIGAARNIDIRLLAFPERSTPSARQFTYDCSDKWSALKKDDPVKAQSPDCGTHDVKAIRSYCTAFPDTVPLMDLMECKSPTPEAIIYAADEHRQQLNLELVRLKSRSYKDETHPWVKQIRAALPVLVDKLTPEQQEELEITFNKRSGELNKTVNMPRLVTLWGLTHDLEGKFLRDDAGKPVGRRYHERLIGSSPFRTRKAGIHRANLYRDYRGTYIRHRMGKLTRSEVVGNAEFRRHRNAYTKMIFDLIKVFKMVEC
jgi:hypothetical protein